MRLTPVASFLPVLLLAACGSEPATAPADSGTPTTTVTEEIVPANGETPAAPVAEATVAASATPPVFAACAVCHTTAKDGPARVGPNLWGVFGSAAAGKPGFGYSPGLKAAGLTWDEATLDKWLTKPAALVPGTHMAFPGQPDAAKRQELIAFLQSLK
ncbi:c-type cytochrome [Sphingomonas sp. dw_22]|uniref:c-type cytochrome n=1 Tax=Sphingomonas sp. dw_22 TaxID=2721175 RepID=UPI001C4A74E6|nr:c-type cytochrome [Sphingomonas sp. dw_22]